MAPVKLETKAIQILAEELQPHEMVVIYLMGLGKEIPDDIGQSNLVSKDPEDPNKCLAGMNENIPKLFSIINCSIFCFCK